MERGNDGAVGKRELPFPKGCYRNIVAQLGAQLLELASFDQCPEGSGAIDRASGRRRVVRENVVAIPGRLVAGEAGLVQRLVSRFAVREVSESPTAGCGVLF